MQAVLLAAGQSSRFYPFTSYKHKSRARLLGKPIFVHTLESIKKAGITDVVIVTGKENFVEEHIGNGEILGLSISYVTQDEPTGMGDALLAAKDVLQENFFVLHPHHVEFHEIAETMLDMQSGGEVVLLAREEEDVEKFGVLRLKGEKVVEIVEKPKRGKEPSHLRVIGIYLLNKGFITTLENADKEHYSFEASLSEHAKNYDTLYVATDKAMASLKYPWDILHINRYLLDQSDEATPTSAHVSDKAILKGKVLLGENVKILEGAVLKGPVYIGDDSIVGTNAIVRDYVTTGEKCVIGGQLEIKNTVLFDNTTTHSGFIGDSVIGSHNKIAAFFCTANVRLDRKNVKVKTGSGDIDSGLRDLGVVMGDHNKIGIRVSTMPGTIIGNNTIIGPSTTVLKNIPDNTTYYTKFREIVEATDATTRGDVANEAMEGKKLVLLDIDYTLFDTGTFKESNLYNYQLYDEVLDVLAALKENTTLGIFSEGELDFQKTKLLKTDIIKHFLDEDIHIVQSKDEKIAEILRLYKDSTIFLVDDKLSVLYAAKNIMKEIFTIWVKRGIYAENQKAISGFTPDFTVYNLKDIVSIIKEVE